MSNATVHIPVLPKEILELGNPLPGQRWADGTAGGGGHCRLLAQRVGETGQVLAVDRDPAVIEALAGTLGDNVVARHASYDDLPEVLNELGGAKVHGILLDLGLSSDQLADRDRGFSFQTEGELDMRFDPTSGEPAWEWLARVDETTLADTIYQYGEERYSRRIARRIVDRRREETIRTADALRDIIYSSVPRSRPSPRGGRRHGRVDPATRTFQALRIVVNDELGILERALERLPECLELGGHLLIISFHSLEDRLVKYAFREDPRLEVVTRRPVQAAENEVNVNPRARSAKLRVARRITPVVEADPYNYGLVVRNK
ncbi:16S rRNA (cytosine(1402)-N(4))-methyltransferase RsmH [Aureliella helgolandensis]|uniref:Ribosomal RNA small subunit methyltransferase H n=1 Tax=Aureliella helgolandensis TaxID=2527968 RepID=A0A518GDI1_9BACT|nr:16S rRNA (cytosine(1402)-N(4))-methyltransferase RsmH [Aureliella helgolandensis]QDV26600.1 Ribosomal RNA small subunit methyltransferase H [Aureliella helgolandensis]